MPASDIGGSASPVRSMFQTHSRALRLVMPISWGMRATGLVQYVEDVQWNDGAKNETNKFRASTIVVSAKVAKRAQREQRDTETGIAARRSARRRRAGRACQKPGGGGVA